MILKVLITSILLWGAAYAADMSLEKDYASALTKAKMTKKPVMYVVSSHNCRYCMILEKNTLNDPKVIDALNRDFVSSIAYLDGGDRVPRDLITGGTPTIWFLKPDGEPLFQPLMGAIDAENFVKALAIVRDEYKKSKWDPRNY